MHTRNTVAEIDLDALEHNLQYYKKITQKDIFAVVKANAYGHGDVLIAKALEDKVKVFCVSSLDEAIHLKKHGIQNDILIFSYVNPEVVFEDDQFIYTIVSKDWFDKTKDLNIRYHLKVDTGMNRIGIKDLEELRMITENTTKVIEGIYTHFSSSDSNKDVTMDQLHQFEKIIATLNYPFKWIHAGNTHASSYIKSKYLNASRIGIGLYGYEKGNNNLKKVLHLETEIIQIHHLKKGESVGYNQAYTLQEDAYIATLPIGYADGFDVRMKHVKINHKKYPIVGKICMDQCMIKVDASVKMFDKVSLISNYDEIFEETSIMPYIVMTSISNRVSRIKKSSSL